MILWANAQGQIVEYDTLDQYTPAISYPRTLEVSATTNPALVLDLQLNLTQYIIGPGNTLLKNGQPVTIAPLSPEDQDRAAMPAILAKLTADQNLTPAETRVVLRALVRESMPPRLGGRRRTQAGPPGVGGSQGKPDMV